MPPIFLMELFSKIIHTHRKHLLLCTNELTILFFNFAHREGLDIFFMVGRDLLPPVSGRGKSRLRSETCTAVR